MALPKLLCITLHPTSTGCWITEDYGKQRIGLEYLWLWVAAFGNIIIYVFLALVFKGIIVVGGEKFQMDTDQDHHTTSTDEQTQGGAIAMQMLLSVAALYLHS